MIKYTDEERVQYIGKCADCGMDYNDFVIDMVIQNKLWEMINPTYHKGCGLLCPNCICARLAELGLCSVNVIVDLSDLLVVERISNG